MLMSTKCPFCGADVENAEVVVGRVVMQVPRPLCEKSCVMRDAKFLPRIVTPETMDRMFAERAAPMEAELDAAIEDFLDAYEDDEQSDCLNAPAEATPEPKEAADAGTE